MTKKEFIKLINFLVKKKLKEILPDMIEKQINKYMQSGIEPDIDYYSVNNKNLVHKMSSKNPIIRDNIQIKQTQSEGKNWSKNPVINKILNETAKNFIPIEKDTSEIGDYKQLMQSKYETIDEEFTFNTKNMMNSLSQKFPDTTQISSESLKRQIIANGAPQKIANIMVKDYSKMLNKMDEMAKKVRNKG